MVLHVLHEPPGSFRSHRLVRHRTAAEKTTSRFRSSEFCLGMPQNKRSSSSCDMIQKTSPPLTASSSASACPFLPQTHERRDPAAAVGGSRLHECKHVVRCEALLGLCLVTCASLQNTFRCFVRCCHPTVQDMLLSVMCDLSPAVLPLFKTLRVSCKHIDAGDTVPD